MIRFNRISHYNYLFCGVILAIFLGITSGCFITNCPPGGKRSGKEITIRQCEPCGPPGSRGRCFGPSICCSQKFGCWIGTAETLSCQLENRFTTVCQNSGATCTGANGDMNGGHCAADNICCNSEMCTTDSTCHEESSLSFQTSGHRGGNQLDALYQHLLEGPPPRSSGHFRSAPSSTDY